MKAYKVGEWSLYGYGTITIFKDKFTGTWADYEIRNEPLSGLYHVLCHKDTRTIISAPANGHHIERYLCFRQFEEHLKTPEDVFRFINMVQTLFPGEIKTELALQQIENARSYQRPQLLPMLDALVNQKNVCSGPFISCSYNLRKETEQKLGRNWIANFKNYPATREIIPAVTLRAFTLAAKRTFYELTDKPCHSRKCNGSRPHLGEAFRIREMPYIIFFASYRNNGGECCWSPEDPRKHVYIFQKYQRPPNYVKIGAYYFEKPNCWDEDEAETLYLATGKKGKHATMKSLLFGEDSEEEVFKLNRSTRLGHEKGYTPNFRLATAEEVVQYQAEHVYKALSNAKEIPVIS
jgi:hypothetical protein